ncbi:MAG: hypothetical protein WBG43_04355 [Marinifilaceae bacterium]
MYRDNGLVNLIIHEPIFSPNTINTIETITSAVDISIEEIAE